MGRHLSASGPLWCWIGLAGCVADTQTLGYARLVEVTLHLDAYEGEVPLLLSAQSGAFYDLIMARSPGVHRLELPAGGSVSTRYPQHVEAAFVLSVTDLTADAEIILASRPLLSSPVPNDGSRLTLEVDPHRRILFSAGCGPGWLPAETVRDLHLPCLAQVGQLVFVDLDLPELRYALRTTEDIVSGQLVVPPKEDFIHPPHTQRWPVVVDPRRSGEIRAFLLGRTGPQSFYPQGDGVAGPDGMVALHYPPAAYDHFDGWVFVQDDTQVLARDVEAGPEAEPIDLHLDLPVIESFSAEVDRATWSVDLPSRYRPLLEIGRLSPIVGTFGGRPAELNRWMVWSHQPLTTSWNRPELPPELAEWALADQEELSAAITYHQVEPTAVWEPRADPLNAPAFVERRALLAPPP